MKGSPEERFWAKVSIADGCWLWTGKPTPHGYGRLNMGGGRYVLAHRLSWALLRGPLSELTPLDHKCHNADKECRGGRKCPHRLCVNPDHLQLSSTGDNVRHGYESRAYCRNGHELTSDNIYAKGAARCRRCHRNANAASKKRLSEAGSNCGPAE